MNPSRIERVTKAANSRWVDIGIVVENVQDIRNLGAVIRTCEAFGIYHIYALFTNSEFEDLTEIFSAATEGGVRGKSCVGGDSHLTVRNKETGMIETIPVEKLKQYLTD